MMSLISNSLFILLNTLGASAAVDVHATTSELLNLLRLQRDVTHEILEAEKSWKVSETLKEELTSVRTEFEDRFSHGEDGDVALVSHPLNLFHLYRDVPTGFTLCVYGFLRGCKYESIMNTSIRVVPTFPV